MNPLYYVIGVTGSGKTTLAMKHAINHPTTNFFIALPSIQAIDEKANELFDLLDSAGVKRPVKRFYSRQGQEMSVVEQIARHVEATPRDAGSIIFITHRAFAMISHWYHADRWHGIIDEVPCISYSFSEPLPDNRHLLLDKLHMSPFAENDRYSIVDAKDIEEIKHIAVNPGGDRVNRIFQDLCEKLTTSSPWQVFWETKQIEQFRTGKITKPTIHALMHPSKFMGFASMTIMGADLMDSIFYHYYRKLGVEFRENRKISATVKQYCASKGRRHDVHSNGNRLTILRLTDRPWSKSLRKMLIDHEGHQRTVMETYKLAINERTRGIPKIWLGNNDMQHGEIDGTRLPGMPQGFNQFQHYDCFVMLSALRPDKSHVKFLQDMTGMTERQIRRAIASQVAIQAMGRGSIRNPDVEQPFLFICPDKDTSDDVEAKYAGCQTGFLLGYDPVPAQKPPAGGRPPKYATDVERKAAKAAQDRIADLRYRTRKNSSLQDGILLTNPDTSIGVASSRIHSMAVSDLDAMATLWPEMNGIAGFSLSHWRHKGDNIGTGCDAFTPATMFAATLRRWQGWEYSKKEKVPMYSPTLFAAELDPIKNRGKENALVMRGLVLDIEHGAISSEEFPAIFPDLQMLIYSSFNHTKDNPRYRICIPTTHFVTPQINEVICWTLAHKLSKLGYGDKGSERPHGLDTGKFEGTSMFYRPSHRPGMFLNEHLTDRRPLNPYQWIDQAPPEAWLAAEMIEEVPQIVPPEEIASRAEDTPERKAARIGGAVKHFRTTGYEEGKGRTKLYGLFKSLIDIGCSDYEASTIMYQETPSCTIQASAPAKSNA